MSAVIKVSRYNTILLIINFVTGESQTEVTVLYIDFGNQERLPLSSLRPLPAELAYLPSQAFPCALSKVFNWKVIASSYVWLCVCICVYIIYIYTYIYIQVYIYIYLYYIYIYIYKCMTMYVCMYIYIYIYMHMHNRCACT